MATNFRIDQFSATNFRSTNFHSTNFRRPHSFSLVIHASSYISGLIRSSIHLFGFLIVHGILKVLQHNGSNESILFLSAFFVVQDSHPHLIIGKPIARTILVFLSNVTSLFFMIVSNSFMAALPSISLLLIS